MVSETFGHPLGFIPHWKMRFKFLPSGEKNRWIWQRGENCNNGKKISSCREGEGKGAQGSNAQRCSAPQRAKPRQGMATDEP